jgi:hypothetical protein
VPSSPANPTSASSAIANKPGDRASPDDATRVLQAATDLSGEANTASSWFRNEPLPAFSSQTAEQLVRDGRTDDVLAYLQSLEAGAAG